MARQYCGALGKIANCQIAVTVALVDGRAGVDAGRDVVSARGVADARRSGTRARIPARVRGQPKWQLALTLLRQVRASGITVTAVLGDAEFGDNATLRRTLHRAQLPYALGVSSTLTVFVGTPAARRARRHAPASVARDRGPTLAPDVSALEARALGRGAARTRVARGVVAQRHAARRGAPGSVPPASRPRTTGATVGSRPRSGCSANAPSARATATKYYLVHLPATASLRTLVRLTHQRWAIEQQYQELKDELGLDHFEGRIAARVAAPRRPHRARLQLAAVRTPPTRHAPADAARRARGDHRDPHRAFLRDAAALL